MKIIFFGSPSSAIPSFKKILECGHRIELVITQPDRPSGRGKKSTPSPVKVFALKQNIAVCQPEKIKKDTEVLEKIKDIEPDLNVVVAYGQIIPAPIIYSPKYRSINLHFSLLPKYRGASPVQWALLNGEKKTGVTIFELNEKMDEGDILSQKKVDIFPEEGAIELEARLAQIGAELLCQTISRIPHIKLVKQNHSLATYAPLIKKDDGKINWNREAFFIERQVRAFTSWPSAYTFIANKRIKIIKGKKENILAPSHFPGEILKIKKEGILVACGNGNVYLIEVLQQENKKVMAAYSYSLGTKIRPGDKFTS